MLTARNVYFAGTALITAGSAIDGGLTAALFVAGGALVFYGFLKVIAD